MEALFNTVLMIKSSTAPSCCLIEARRPGVGDSGAGAEGGNEGDAMMMARVS